MVIKICGITRLEDAELAVAEGANAIGFVFWPQSPRWIDPFRARSIAAALPPFVTRVGVFVDQPSDYVNGVAQLVRLSAVQLHGGESLGYAAGIDGPVIKAIGLHDEAMSAIDTWPLQVTVMLDVHDPVRRGGTGKVVNWTAAASVARRRRIVLAGGLTPDNVVDAVTQVQPFGVDVSSGVESAPGLKDHTRLKAFLEAVHGTPYATRS